MGYIDDLADEIYDMSIPEIRARFPFIGEGISRAVYAIDNNYVFKIAKDLDGDYQCRIERHIYKHAGRYRDYLCPIVWYRTGMIVMPRALPMSSIIASHYLDISRLRYGRDCYRDLVELSRKFNLLFDDIISTSSWGLINNIPVLIDYGCTN